ncbi:MAG TPA: exosortase/archaeosortase family protein [Fimbriimonadaceae bacterium]|nr:exosortase/archaeosortase family protein [Fimbriimonadaceae bacterium]
MAVVQDVASVPGKVGWLRGVGNWFFNRKATPIWVLIGLVSLAFWPTYLYWWTIWFQYQSPFGYGYLVPPCVLFLIWSRRDQIAAVPRESGNLWILVPIVLAIVLHAAALIARVNIVSSFSFFVLTMTLPYLIWGKHVYRYIWGALAFSATMLPWPPQIYGKLLLPAQEISTQVAVKMLQWTGLSTVVDGTSVTINNYEFNVAAACSGLTIVFPIVAIVIMSVMMINAPAWKKVALLGLAIPLSIFSNAVRIWTIAMIGQYMGAQTADSLHDPSGVAAVIFATILLTLLMSVMKANDYKDEYMPAFARDDDVEDEEVTK